MAFKPKPLPPTAFDPQGNLKYAYVYEHLEDHEVSRLNADIDAADYNTIKFIGMDRGTIQTVTSILWYKLCRKLEQLNINDFSDANKFKRFLAECELTHPDLDTLAANREVVDALAVLNKHSGGHAPVARPTHPVHGGTTGGAAVQTDASHDGRGTPGAGGTDSHPAVVSPNVPRGVKQGSGKGKRGGASSKKATTV